jgi:hypothetical protein
MFTAMGRTLGIMITSTTYGTWLRGDKRGWIDDGRLMPPDPELEAADRRRLKHARFLFQRGQLLEIGRIIGQSLVTRLDVPVLALHAGSWHFHLVVGVQPDHVPDVVKSAKDAVRFKLLPSRPIWTANYDTRCFDASTLRRRVRYVERHNEALGWPPRPWEFVTPLDQYLNGARPRATNGPHYPRFFKPGAHCGRNRSPRFEEPGAKCHADTGIFCIDSS